MTFLNRLVKKAAKAAPTAVQDTAAPALNYEDLQRTSVLFAQPFSGRHGLKASLAEYCSMHLPPAPFSVHGGAHGGYTYRTYVEDDPKRLHAALIDPTAAIYSFLGAFFATQPRTGPILLDVSYADAARMGMDGADMMPTLFKVFKNLEVPVIHLMRRDVVSQAISLAVQNNGAHDAAAKLWLDPEGIVKTATARRDAVREAARQLAFIGLKSVTVSHEDLSSERGADALRRVFKHIDIYGDIPTTFEPKALIDSGFDAVANLTEIRDFAAQNDANILFS